MECQKYGCMAFDYIKDMNNELKIINGNEYYIEHIKTIFDDYDWMEYIFNIEISKKQSYERVFVNILFNGFTNCTMFVILLERSNVIKKSLYVFDLCIFEKYLFKYFNQKEMLFTHKKCNQTVSDIIIEFYNEILKNGDLQKLTDEELKAYEYELKEFLDSYKQNV